MHFGNPFYVSNKKTKLGKVEVANLRDCLLAFNDWLDGTAHQDVEPERRQWILDNLELLRGETIGCFCKPKPCHGDIYRGKLGEITLEEVMAFFDEPKAPTPQTPRDAQFDLF
jgi:hypothetical protein